MLSSRIAIAAGAAATAGVAYLYFRKRSKDAKGFGAMLLCKAFLFFEEKKGLTPREQELWVEATDKRGDPIEMQHPMYVIRVEDLLALDELLVRATLAPLVLKTFERRLVACEAARVELMPGSIDDALE